MSCDAGTIPYMMHPFWQEKYCPSHASDGTPRCAACERMQPRSQPFAPLGDGRALCLECVASVVVDSSDAAPLYDQARASQLP